MKDVLVIGGTFIAYTTQFQEGDKVKIEGTKITAIVEKDGKIEFPGGPIRAAKLGEGSQVTVVKI